jgi:pSer/pThr/pTyr-binding forkhead associated (FHA) protein/tetratricopeptide (TPR) repeat protein
VSKLVIFRGDAVETELHLGRDTVRIGRDERNAVVLNDKSISRFHAEVRQEGGTFYIVDMKSRNGVHMNGHQIKGKAALTLGVPVTVGAYELVLEDDLSTGDLGEAPGSGRTVVSAGTGATASNRPSRSGTQRWAVGSTAAGTLMKRPAVFWSGLAVITLIVCGLTYVIVRSFMRKPSPPVEIAQVTTSVPIEQPAPAPPDHKAEIDQHLANGRDAIERKDYDAAITEAEAIQALDPENQDGADLKRQAEEAKTAAAASAAAAAAGPKKQQPAQPTIPEISGITVRPGESQADYTTRVNRIKQNLQDGLHMVERQEFIAAFAKFDLVRRDQPGYSSIDDIIAETKAKQKQAVDNAIATGQKSQQEGNVAEAMKWYRQAQTYDHESTAARDRMAALTDLATKQGADAYNTAEVYRKRGDNAKALPLYRLAADLLPNGPEKTQAQQWLEKLKP